MSLIGNLRRKKKLLEKFFSTKVSSFWEYFLKNFNILPVTKEVLKITKGMIEMYGLLPNDALVLATCKYYGIKYLLSIDSDFPEPCQKEGITLINSAEKLKEILNQGL